MLYPYLILYQYYVVIVGLTYKNTIISSDLNSESAFIYKILADKLNKIMEILVNKTKRYNIHNTLPISYRISNGAQELSNKSTLKVSHCKIKRVSVSAFLCSIRNTFSSGNYC